MKRRSHHRIEYPGAYGPDGPVYRTSYLDDPMMVEFEIYQGGRLTVEATEVATIVEPRPGTGDPVIITTKEGEKFQLVDGYHEIRRKVIEGRKPRTMNQDPAIGGCLRT